MARKKSTTPKKAKSGGIVSPKLPARPIQGPLYNAQKWCQDAILLKQTLEQHFIFLASRLWDIKEKESWKGMWEDFEDFCENGMKIDVKTAYKLILIHERFVLEYKIEPVLIAEAGGWTRVDTIMPVVKDKKTAEQWLNAAGSARSRSELRRLVELSKPGAIDSIECKHKNTRQITLIICDDCKEKWEDHA